MKRVIYNILKQIAEDNKYGFETFCHDWVIRLSNKNKKLTVYGYIMQGSDSVSQMLCKDKSALYEILSNNNIPAVPHILHLGKKRQLVYIGREIGIEDIYSFFEENSPMVIKDNGGGGGSDVYLIKNKEDIKPIADDLLARDKDISFSPYFNVEDEYRIIVYKNQPQIVFKKQRPMVVGNGIQTIKSLMEEKYGKILKVDKWIDLEYIPKKNEKVVLRWIHNLKQGACPVEVLDEEKKKQLFEIAQTVTKIIGINFASVDIIDVEGKLMVLEVNSAVTLERFAKSSQENYKQVEELYKKIVFEVLK